MDSNYKKTNVIKTNHASEIEELAAQVITLARDHILMNLRFLDVALSNLTPVCKPELIGVASDGAHFYYDPYFLLRRYRNEPSSAVRLLLHSLLHCIFFHSFGYEKLDVKSWDLVCDMAVEATVLSMRVPGAALKRDAERAAKLAFYEKEAYGLTAEKLYKYFRNFPPMEEDYEQLHTLFVQDLHNYWIKAEPDEIIITQQQWKKISERVKADLKSFSKDKNGSESLEENLREATRERYDYAAFLKRFVVSGEDVRVNDDEFDYIYYTYGLAHYGNMPLVEPLEYRDVQKIRDFCIVIDTSASCRGEIVRAFLNKTYNLLKSEDTFFRKSNIHIIQCDSEVQSDVKVTCDEEFEEFMKTGKLKGFGSTDFRPAFEYVNGLQELGEFDRLKGLIYFTDGYGIYPEKKPDYDVVFAFLDEDERRAPVPPWAIKLVLDSEWTENSNDRTGRGGF